MGQDVTITSGHVINLTPDPNYPSSGTVVTGNTTTSWQYKASPFSTFQAVVNGSGAVAATVTYQVSNDGVNPVNTPLGVSTLSGTTTASDGFTTQAPWKYIRAVISGASGSITSIVITMGV